MTRLSKDLAFAIVIGSSIGLTLMFLGVGEALRLTPANPLRDWHAYWDAALRLRAGGELYPLLANPDAETTYRYAPWFAAAWIPLTYLPHDLVGRLWTLVLLSASVAAVLPLLSTRRLPATLLAAVLFPFLVQASTLGNVQPILVASLVHGVDRRWGPLAVGIAASLKIFPVAYAFYYAIRGEWARCFASVAITVVLSGSYLLFDMRHYPFLAGPTGSLWLLGPIPWAIGIAAAVAALIQLRSLRGGWFRASVTVVLASPRLLQYDLTYLLVTGRDVLDRRGAGARREAVRPLVSRAKAAPTMRNVQS